MLHKPTWKRHVLFALLLLTYAACNTRTRWGGEADLYGVLLVIEPNVSDEYLASDFRDRFRATLALTARYVGYEPDDLSGLRVVISHDIGAQCPALKAGEVIRLGCYDPDTNTAWVFTDPYWYSMVESTELSHEILHYFIGDPLHLDARWNEWGPLYDRLHEGRTCSAAMECYSDRPFPCSPCPYYGQWGT